MEQLLGLPYAQVLERAPGLALRGLAIAAVQAVALANDSDFSGPFALGRGDRLSVQTLIDLFESYQGRSIADFVEMLIESCTVGQHFATAASRLEPGKNKYRFVPSEHGLEPLFDPDKVLRVDVTPDRLGTAMSLMRDCGLLSRTADPDVFGLPK